MGKRVFLGVILLTFIQGCTSPQLPVPETPSEQTAPTLTPRRVVTLAIPTITSTPIPLATYTPQPTSTTKPSATVAPSYTPDIVFLTEWPEPTVIYHPVITPTTPLDPGSYESVLDWIKFSFAHQDLSVIESLARDKIHYGISEAEYNKVLTKAELMEALTAHLAPETQCLAYTYRAGEINSLEVFIANWAPDWQYGGRRTDDLILYFSDQDDPERRLSVIAVALPQMYDQHYVMEIFEHMCFE